MKYSLLLKISETSSTWRHPWLVYVLDTLPQKWYANLIPVDRHLFWHLSSKLIFKQPLFSCLFRNQVLYKVLLGIKSVKNYNFTHTSRSLFEPICCHRYFNVVWKNELNSMTFWWYFDFLCNYIRAHTFPLFFLWKMIKNYRQFEQFNHILAQGKAVQVTKSFRITLNWWSLSNGTHWSL